VNLQIARLHDSQAGLPMQPIHELLNQIRWDPNFNGDFEIAFVDHTEPELIRVAVRDMRFTEGRFAFEMLTADDAVVSIPLHRIRQVYRDGRLIWSRPESSE
jgi:uncharacterized protein (UPF0248 family)